MNIKRFYDKTKWSFYRLCENLFYWLSWCYSTERHDPYCCTECGSTDVEIKVWSKVNEGGRYGGDCEEFDRSFCNDCNSHVRVQPTSSLLESAEQWWQENDFRQLEKLTGLRQDDFSPEDGYQEFVDACNDWWRKLSPQEKITTWLKE